MPYSGLLRGSSPLLEAGFRRRSWNGENVKPRVLITSAGTPAGTALAAEFRSRGIPLLRADSRELPDGSGVSAVRVPPPADPEMIPVLRRIIAREGINLVIPAATGDLVQVSAARAGFGRDVRVIVADPGPVALANDRLFTAWQLRSAGVPVPRFGVPGDFADAGAAMAALDGPVVVRPRCSYGGDAVFVVDGTEDLKWAGLPDGRIVQEYIPGTEYAPMVYGTPAHNGVAPFAVVVEKTWLEGRGVLIRRVLAGEAMDVGNAAMAAVRALGLTGPVHVDVRRRADGTPVVLGVTACFGAYSESAPELLDAVLASFDLPAFNPASFRQGSGLCARVPV